MDGFFRALKQRSATPTWTKAVELARESVSSTAASIDDDPLALQVDDPTSRMTHVVQLFVDDEDWLCDCGGREDPCRHVIAAAIALKQARVSGQTLARQATKDVIIVELCYEFVSRNDHLHCERRLRDKESGETLKSVEAEASLLQIKKDHESWLVESRTVDLEAEQILRLSPGKTLSSTLLARLMKILSGDERCSFMGSPVTVIGRPFRPTLRLEDDGPGIRLKKASLPGMEVSFQNGGVIVDGTLGLLDIPELTPADRELVRSGRFFAQSEFGQLAGEILPRLRSKFLFDVATKHLPELTAGRPLLSWDLEPLPDSSDVLVRARIVYGTPPIAVVEGGELRLLGKESPRRDPVAEWELKDQLSRRWQMEPGSSRRMSADAAVQFREKLQSRAERLAKQSEWDSYKVRGKLTLKFDLNYSEADLAFGLTGGGSQASPDAVLRAFKNGEPLVRLIDGDGFAELPKETLERYLHLIEEIVAAKELGWNRAHVEAIGREFAAISDTDVIVKADVTKLKDKLQRDVASWQAPPDLRAELRPYQRDGCNFLHILQQGGLGALLADDMGLGKTLQTLAVIDGKTLVVCPKSVLSNWEAEANKFRPNLKCHIYHGAERRLEPSADLTLTTYALLRSDLDMLRSFEWSMVVLDEAQMIKNPDSGVAKAAYKLEADFRLALTGTPVENRLEELWSLIHFICPGLLSTRAHFKKHYVAQLAQGDEERQAALQRRIRPYLLRRLKREVAKDLPERTEIVHKVELSEAERQIYDVLELAARSDLQKKLEARASVLDILEGLLRLRQSCCHPALVPGQMASDSAKVRELVAMLQEIVDEGHKALVFSQWTAFLNLIEPHLIENGWSFSRIDGSTNNRGQLVSEFQDAKGPPIMLISLKAGGTGLNLTAADHVFLMDPWWNPAVEDQAADRAHRIGQTQPVFIHKLIAEASVEERILLLQQKKRALSASAIGEGSSQALTREDLLALLD